LTAGRRTGAQAAVTPRPILDNAVYLPASPKRERNHFRNHTLPGNPLTD
jgi:hypothetical protein